MADRDNLLAPWTIAATNVRPAYEQSLHFGATEAEIERHCGLSRAALAAEDAAVTGEATYLHMELMYGKPSFVEFLVATAGSHTLSSLGVVGLACKTAQTVGEAIACHHRYQQLTNRTAQYASAVQDGTFVLREDRPGAPRQGSLLVSDYAMMIAAHLVRESAGGRAGCCACEADALRSRIASAKRSRSS